jgi:hypothetical protein
MINLAQASHDAFSLCLNHRRISHVFLIFHCLNFERVHCVADVVTNCAISLSSIPSPGTIHSGLQQRFLSIIQVLLPDGVMVRLDKSC